MVGTVLLASRFVRGTKLLFASVAILVAALFGGRYHAGLAFDPRGRRDAALPRRTTRNLFNRRRRSRQKMRAGARNCAKDRRGTQRARLAAPTVTVTVGGLLVDAVGSDVSPGGMRLMSARPVRIGDAVSPVFFLDGDIFCARGKVCWCARTRQDLFAFGIPFTAVEEDGASLLARFCRGSVS